MLGRGHPASQAGLLGVQFGVQVPWGERLSWRVDARVLRGEAFDPLGTVGLFQASGTAALLVRGGSGPLRLAVGPQVEVGVGRVSGESDAQGVSANSGSRAVVSGAAVGQLAGAVSDAVRLLGSVEIGATAVGLTARADGRRVAGLQGVFLGAALGVGWGR